MTFGKLIFLTSFLTCSRSSAQEHLEFWDACAKGDAETVNRHVNDEPGLAKKSTVDGETCLHLTAISNAFSISELMIKLGSDVNSRVTHSEGLRMTPLSWHVYSGNTAIVSLLLENGAKVNDVFDAMYDRNTKHTVMDVAEALSNQHLEEQSADDKFMDTFLILKKYGGLKYSELN